MPYAYFRVIAADLPIDEVTRIMGISPTESWRKGDEGRYNKSRPNGGWCLHSTLPSSNNDLSEHIESVLAQLAPRMEAVRLLGSSYSTYLACVGSYDESSSPGLFLSRQVVATIAELGLAIDADLYFQSQGQPPN